MLKQYAQRAASICLLAGLIVYTCTQVHALKHGVSGRTYGCFAGGEQQCHSADAATKVTFASATTTYLPSTVYDFTATVRNPAKLGAGIDIAADSGILIPGDGMQEIMGEVTHTAPHLMSNGEAVFHFQYKTPATPGTYTLIAAGNAVNMDDSPGGDGFALAAPLRVEVASASVDEPSSAVASRLELFPNPSNNSVTLVLPTPASSITVIDAQGTTLPIRNRDVLPFDATHYQVNLRSLAAGTYIVVARTATGVWKGSLVVLR